MTITACDESQRKGKWATGAKLFFARYPFAKGQKGSNDPFDFKTRQILVHAILGLPC